MADQSEQDENLDRLNKVVNEIEAHHARLIRDAKHGKATPGSVMQEMSETVMPLLRDFARRIFAEVLAVREYIHEEVEPALMQLNAADSVLIPEDAELITARLLSYREMLEGLILRAVGDDKAKMEAELSEVDTTLARVAEITAEDDDPDEPGDPDEPEEPEEPAAEAN